MPPLVHEGSTKVFYVPTIADVTAPTAAEMGAGTDLTPYVLKNGLSTPSQRSMVDTGSIETRFDSQAPGSYGGNVTLRLKRQLPGAAGATAAWTLFEPGFVDGYIVVGRLGSADQTGDEVEVYPGQSHKPAYSDTGKDTEQTFTVEWAVTDEPETGATVAA